MSKLTFNIRNATTDDLDEIMRVEQSWEEAGRGTVDKFISRIEKFPEGFFLAFADDSDGKLAASITSMPMIYDPENIGAIKNWENLTNNGYLPEQIDTNSCNALYIVSGIIEDSYRGQDIFEPMVLKVVSLAKELGMHFVVAGAVIPGFRKYKDKNPDISAYDYIQLRSGTSLVDPLLNMYESIGFSVPGPSHVLPEYFLDDASLNYAAMVVMEV